MLESTNEETFVGESEPDQKPAFLNILGKLPFKVQVPRSKLDELKKSGPCLPCMSDQRQHVRFRHLQKGILGYRQTFATIDRLHELHQVLITNISKTGIGVYHSEQLFPHEKLFLWTEEQGILQVNVARCRRVNQCCFEIGFACPQLASMFNEKSFLV